MRIEDDEIIKKKFYMKNIKIYRFKKSTG